MERSLGFQSFWGGVNFTESLSKTQEAYIS